MSTNKEPYSIEECHLLTKIDSKRDYQCFSCYSDNSPYEGDILIIEDSLFEVVSVVDDTDDEDREQGLSYDKIWMQKIMTETK